MTSQITLIMRATTLVVCLLLQTAHVFAAPAAYYIWKSKTSDAQLCAQTSPGEFWDKATGPYKDPHCEKPALVNEPAPPVIILVPVPIIKVH
ncbi:hypothetical protein [Undibacterium sp. RuRC25W]|uniref:hypothetical protein n=1 Tax=Undibacterium sp. RuRC25W TaxID=3413047 RepID=UPI003BEF97CE